MRGGLDAAPLPEGGGIPAEDWQHTPRRVGCVVLTLLKRLEALASRLHQDASTSSRSPSAETPTKQGHRWVERILSRRHICRIRGRPTFPLLVDAVTCLFQGERPDLSWITPYDSLPMPSTL